ncbi:MAG: MoxR family ATPase [Eubacteriaceae bacterium]|nr:MoxR family ATPase [Eubacteriaceae bacterium]
MVGQSELCRMLSVCMIAGGHVLIEGVPGVGKTLAARTMAKAVDVHFKRVQFTPDLMPSDILGTNVFDAQSSAFKLHRGPIFTNFLLADEINRTPPKTQSALLEAMEEGRVTIDGTEYRMAQPFMVFATQNPIEYEGTYPLPEAQLDRFMMKLIVSYPLREEEIRLYNNIQQGFDSQAITEIKPVLNGEKVLAAREEMQRVRVDASLLSYIYEILDATRRDPGTLLGASPRAGVAVLSAGKALALIEGRDFCIPEDFRGIANAVLRHRLILTPDAEIDGSTPDAIVSRALGSVTVPR